VLAAVHDVKVASRPTFVSLSQNRQYLRWSRYHNPAIFLYLPSALSARTILMDSHDSTLLIHLSLTHRQMITSFAFASDCYHYTSTQIGSYGTPLPYGKMALKASYPVKLGRAFQSTPVKARATNTYTPTRSAYLLPNPISPVSTCLTA
jgi:hypothetical protein